MSPVDPKRIQRKRTKGWRMPEGAAGGKPTRNMKTRSEEILEEGNSDRAYLGIDGTMGDAQDVLHPFLSSVYGEHCRLCGLARAYWKHDD